MFTSIAALDAVGMSSVYTVFAADLAERLLASGRADEAGRLIDAVLERSTMPHWGRPEFMRLKACVLRDLEVNGCHSSKALLESARALAESQGAHAWRNRIIADLQRYPD